MADMQAVVVKLAGLTENGQVPWKTTVDRSAFAATFGNLSVLISSRDHLTDLSTTYRLVVLDEQGNEVDSESVRHTSSVLLDDSVPPLVKLFTFAKRSALGASERLDELLKAIDRVANA